MRCSSSIVRKATRFGSTNPCGTGRHLLACLRKSLEWFRSIAVVADKRRQISKAMRSEDVAEIMKVASSIDTSSHEDGHTVCEPERQVGDELALVAQHPVDSYGIARSHSAGWQFPTPLCVVAADVTVIRHSPLVPVWILRTWMLCHRNVFSEFLTKQVLCRLM